jgi:hypothetical protein
MRRSGDPGNRLRNQSSAQAMPCSGDDSPVLVVPGQQQLKGSCCGALIGVYRPMIWGNPRFNSLFRHF